MELNMNTKTNRLLVAVLVLQVLTLAGSWGMNYVAEARADVPNPAERQLAMTEELKSVNQKLDKLVSVLESGRLKVEVTNIGDANKNGKK
jgi:hypothetical protein